MSQIGDVKSTRVVPVFGCVIISLRKNFVLLKPFNVIVFDFNIIPTVNIVILLTVSHKTSVGVALIVCPWGRMATELNVRGTRRILVLHIKPRTMPNKLPVSRTARVNRKAETPRHGTLSSDIARPASG